MCGVGQIGSETPETQDKNETQRCHVDIRIGVFFDGTGNNANNNAVIDWFKFRSVVEKNHALNNTIELDAAKKLSNPAILSSLFTENSDIEIENKQNKVIHCYIEGSGTNGFEAKTSFVDFLINGKAVRGLGFGVGSTGVVAKVGKAINLISSQLEGIVLDDSIEIDSIHFYVFGFSRGSACARLFSYLVARASDKNVTALRKSNNDRIIAKDVEKEFKPYLRKKYFDENKKVNFLRSKGLEKLENSSITVDFLGIYDTVSAIGFLKEENDKVNRLRTLFMVDSDFWDNFHKDNSMCYGLFSPTLSPVLSTCHICAMDEFRANFALTDIAEAAFFQDNIELFLPGCHSDIGGGYTRTSKEEYKTLNYFYHHESTKEDEADNEEKTNVYPTYFCGGNPMKESWVKLEMNSLVDSGWIDPKQDEKKDTSDSITFKHKPQPEHQWSNISLKFMYERLREKIGKSVMEKLFSAFPENEYSLDHCTSIVYDDIKLLLESNGRFYYGVKNGDYPNLRKKYIHFTSTDKIHSAGDPGNVPGRILRDGGSRICRYVYSGYNPDNCKTDNKISFLTTYTSIEEIGSSLNKK